MWDKFELISLYMHIQFSSAPLWKDHPFLIKYQRTCQRSIINEFTFVLLTLFFKIYMFILMLIPYSWFKRLYIFIWGNSTWFPLKAFLSILDLLHFYINFGTRLSESCEASAGTLIGIVFKDKFWGEFPSYKQYRWFFCSLKITISAFIRGYFWIFHWLLRDNKLLIACVIVDML